MGYVCSGVGIYIFRKLSTFKVGTQCDTASVYGGGDVIEGRAQEVDTRRWSGHIGNLSTPP